MKAAMWKNFIKEFNLRGTHWYVSKAKSYSDAAIQDLQEGLRLLKKWFVETDELEEEEISLISGFIGARQLTIDETRRFVWKWDHQTQLLYTYLLDWKGLITSMNQTYRKVRGKYEAVYHDIRHRHSFEELEEKHGHRLLGDIAANARNFISWYSKMGLAWIEPGKVVAISSTGIKFIDPSLDVRDVLQRQLSKLQIWNPSLPRRYRGVHVFPFFCALRILLDVEGNYVTKREYALFVTSIQTMDEIGRAVSFIHKFRGLSKQSRDQLVRQLISASKRKPRSYYDEYVDSARKEMDFLSMGKLISPIETRSARGICLAEGEKEAARELLEGLEDPVFVHYEEPEDWFAHYGDWESGASIYNALEYYTEIGDLEKAKTLIDAADYLGIEEKADLVEALRERRIEDFFCDHLEQIEPGLRLYFDGKNDGRQYITEIGRIDLLCIDKSGLFTVVEFKREKAPDKAVGQILRYIGWVYHNLSPGNMVRGILVAKDFDDKIKYAVVGVHQFGGEPRLEMKVHSLSTLDVSPLSETSSI